MNEYYESKVKPTASLKGTYQVKKEDDEAQRVRFPAPVGTPPPARTSTVHHSLYEQSSSMATNKHRRQESIKCICFVSDRMSKHNE